MNKIVIFLSTVLEDGQRMVHGWARAVWASATRIQTIPLLSDWDVALKTIHRIDERSKPLIQRGNMEHVQPWEQETTENIRLGDETDVIEDIFPTRASIPPLVPSINCLLFVAGVRFLLTKDWRL